MARAVSVTARCDGQGCVSVTVSKDYTYDTHTDTVHSLVRVLAQTCDVIIMKLVPTAACMYLGVSLWVEWLELWK